MGSMPGVRDRHPACPLSMALRQHRYRDSGLVQYLGFCDGGRRAEPNGCSRMSRHRNLFARNRGERVAAMEIVRLAAGE